MGCFPLFIELADRPCLVAGGGKVALRKVQKLLPFGPRITVVAPSVCPQLAAVPEELLEEGELRVGVLGIQLEELPAQRAAAPRAQRRRVFPHEQRLRAQHIAQRVPLAQRRLLPALFHAPPPRSA